MKRTSYSRFLVRAAVTLLAVFSFLGARAQEPCSKPQNFVVSDITARKATVTWEGTSASYVVMIGKENFAASADFETGDLSQAGFTTTTNYPFTVVENNHIGAYCAKNGNVGHPSTTSNMVLTVTLSDDATQSFSAKVSSESGSDKAYFSIDGTKKSDLNGISGNGDWIDYSYPLTAGTHTLRWFYTKDDSGNDNDSGNLNHTGKAITLRACRAYFQFSEAATARQFVLNFGDDSATLGIISVEDGKLNVEGGDWYTVDGVKLGKKPVRKGLYINNGKKVVIK